MSSRLSSRPWTRIVPSMPLTVSDYETGVQPPGGGSNYLNSYE